MSEQKTAYVLALELVNDSAEAAPAQSLRLSALRELLGRVDEVVQAQQRQGLLVQNTERGLNLVFFGDIREPLRTALTLDRLLRTPGTRLALHMGVHSGLVDLIFTVAHDWEALGEGIDGALRVMKLGDAGHILLSETVAKSVLENWEFRELLQKLGAYQESGGKLQFLYNLCSRPGIHPPVGNESVPKKVFDNRLVRESHLQRDEVLVVEETHEETRASVWRSVLYLVIAAAVIGFIWFVVIHPVDRENFLREVLHQRK